MEGILFTTPPPPWIFHFCRELMAPPSLWNFHKYDKDPPTPLEKSFSQRKTITVGEIEAIYGSTQPFPSEACMLLFPSI